MRQPGPVPICGLNFHGNLALKNCARGNVPHRHEKLAGALPVLAAPAGGDRTGDRAKEDEAAKEEWRPRRRRCGGGGALGALGGCRSGNVMAFAAVASAVCDFRRVYRAHHQHNTLKL